MLLGDSFSDTVGSKKDRQEGSGRSGRWCKNVVVAKLPWIRCMKGRHIQGLIAAFLHRFTSSWLTLGTKILGRFLVHKQTKVQSMQLCGQEQNV